MSNIEFSPSPGLRNPHVQTMISSLWPRRIQLARRARRSLGDSEDVILNCSDGVRLHGMYTPALGRARNAMAILLHGWEGCAESSYQISAACTLVEAGYDVFRLHLRDHGPSHALNPELFNSARLQEVIDAVGDIQSRFPHRDTFLAGHSLGGNFCLRVAARAPQAGLNLTRVVAVCPVLDPQRSHDALENGSQIYHRYFVGRWKRSLARKLDHYPELGYGDYLGELRTLTQMNDFFVPRFTDYDDTPAYFEAYALTGDTLADLAVRCHLILSLDDPMIPADDLARIAHGPKLTIETPTYGGHCGFLMNWRMEGWIDHRLLELFGEDNTQPSH